jgi:alpha-tubulin suppressor-like RCC1 family protein
VLVSSCCHPAGNNVFGQLGLGNFQPANTLMPISSLESKDVVALQAGDFSSAAICDSGSVYLWGRNDCNQLGMGDDMSRNSPALLKGFKVISMLDVHTQIRLEWQGRCFLCRAEENM